MKTIVLAANNVDDVIAETLKILKSGGLVVFPADTVYGLLVDATNETAVKKLISFKNRAPGKAISVFVSDMEMLKSYVELKSSQIEILNHLLPGPFTVILHSKQATSRLLESEKGTLGVRLINHPLVKSLVTRFKKPVTATSANLAGKSPHYSIHSLLNQLPRQKQELIDLIVDTGTLPRNKPSTVVDLTESKIKILRQGDIVFNDQESFISKSPSQTQKIGRYIVEQQVKKSKGKPIVIILQGDLGSGKTVMAKGIASYFDIHNIISPTFVVYYEYEIKSTNYELPTANFKKFVHADLYNIEEPEEFKHLGLENYLKPGNVMVIEWGEKLGELFDKFKSKAKLVYVNIKSKGENVREISVSSE